MKHLKRGISLVLAFVLALSLTACGDTTWVYKYDDVTITSGIYLAFLLDGYSQVVSEESLDTQKETFCHKTSAMVLPLLTE